MRPDEAIYVPWLVWAASWRAAAAWSGRTVNRPVASSQAFYRIVEFAGFAFLLAYIVRRAPRGPYEEWSWTLPLWILSDSFEWAAVGVAVLGFLFCWWARIHLGRLWSGSVTHKEGHRVVSTGPYAFVRHPIYTGVIVAALTTMIVRGTAIAVAGTALIIVGYWMKARLEERFLRAELGTEAYDAYAARTAMLMPFVRL
jgi:protein-S-isoprenylcysteine O-methyltransferase Ste14